MTWDEPAPGEQEAERRSWDVVRTAWAEQPRHGYSRRSRRWPALGIAVAALAIVAAAAFSSPGRAVLRKLQHAVQGEKNARPALYSLPAAGRLLVESDRGVWVVQRDGSKRLLRGYRDASWSPHGVYLAAVRGSELRALEPDGAVHWSLARPGGLASPRWTDATPPCCRIAYLAGRTLRVVNGDGTDDRLLAARVAPVAPAWRPHTHVVAYADRNGIVHVVLADTGRRLRAIRPAQRPYGLQWSSDGRFLLVRGAHSFELFGPGTRHLQPLGPGAGGVAVLDAALSPNGRTVASIQLAPTREGTRSFLWRYSRLRPDDVRATPLLAGAGRFADVEWSPDGRWLLLNWPSADQWLFIRSATVSKIRAVSNIRSSFGPNARVAGWCCS
jgi:hypothetical protein